MNINPNALGITHEKRACVLHCPVCHTKATCTLVVSKHNDFVSAWLWLEDIPPGWAISVGLLDAAELARGLARCPEHAPSKLCNEQQEEKNHENT